MRHINASQVQPNAAAPRAPPRSATSVPSTAAATGATIARMDGQGQATSAAARQRAPMDTGLADYQRVRCGWDKCLLLIEFRSMFIAYGV